VKQVRVESFLKIAVVQYLNTVVEVWHSELTVVHL